MNRFPTLKNNPIYGDTCVNIMDFIGIIAIPKRYRSSKIICALLLTFSVSHAALQESKNDKRPVIANVVVVKFKTDALKKSVSSLAADQLGSIGIERFESVIHRANNLKKNSGAIGLDRVYNAYYNDQRTPEEVAQALRLNSSVEYAEPKYIHHVCAVPNDSLTSLQLGYLNRLLLTEAWDLSKGEKANVVIAIVDGGTNILHPDLAANLWQNPKEIPGNGKDDDQNGHIDDVYGWNFAKNSADPTGLSNTPINAEHGTHVAGICCAVTNNQKGMAGTGWNAKLMAINCSSPYSDNAILSGYEGIIYAAETGANIINCSWGSLGSASLYEQDVVHYALELGSVIVAAAGNDNDSTFHYPSSYEGVLSVAALNNNNVRASFSNFGKAIDVAVPGINIYGSVGLNNYKTLSGTSMASPQVAGIVALVKAAHPDWSNLQAAEQVRITCSNIDAFNPNYVGKLGRGQVNAYSALTTVTPSIRIDQIRVVDENQDGVIKPGERVKIYLSLINYLARATSIQVTLKETSPYAELTSNTSTISEMATLQKLEMTTPFELIVQTDAPRGHLITFTLETNSGAYSDTDHFNLSVLPPYGNIEINHLATSITNIGRIGFGDTDDSKEGLGFKYKKGANLIFEGAIICGTGPDRLASASRGDIPPGKASVAFNADFVTTADGDLQFLTPGLRSDQESIGVFDDRNANRPMSLRITQKTFANQSKDLQDFVLFEYNIENLGNEVLAPFHFGFLFDWDIDGGHYNTNMVAYDANRRLGYAYNAGDGPDTYVGMAVLDNVGISSRAIYNDQRHPLNKTWGIYDGFTIQEKWESISAGTTNTEAGPADISHVIAAGPFTLRPHDLLTLHLVLAAGSSLNELRNTVDAAKSFQLVLSTKDNTALPTAWSLAANYPNPFNATTVIDYELRNAGEVKLEVFDLIGRKVKTLLDRTQPAGQHRLIWDGRDDRLQPMPSGTYFYRMQTDGFHRTRKMVLLR